MNEPWLHDKVVELHVPCHASTIWVQFSEEWSGLYSKEKEEDDIFEKDIGKNKKRKNKDLRDTE